MSKVPKGTYVTVTEDDHECVGRNGYVYRVAGDSRPDGDEIPRGWCELVFDPTPGAPIHTELFRVEDVAIEAC